MSVVLVDSSVLLDVLTEDPSWAGWSSEALEHELPLQVCGVQRTGYDRAMRSRDTDRKALDVQRAVLRRLGPARRVELAFEMSEQARALSIQGAMAREPGLAPEEARARLLRRLLGDALYRAAWPARAGR